MSGKRFMASLFLLVCISIAPAAAEWLPQLTEPMPVVSITTGDGSNHFATAYVREDKLNGRIDYTDASISVSRCKPEEVLVNEAAEVKVRGNWTLDYPKKSIRIKFEEKQSMLSLNGAQKFKNWVLLAEWKDLSMLNSAVALYLARNILNTEDCYCTDYRFVELYINGDYWGVYLLAEQQEAKAGRVNLPQPEEGSVDKQTGYFFEYDAYYLEEAALPAGNPVMEVYHTGFLGEQYGYTITSDISDERQTRFLRSQLQRIYEICYSAVAKGQYYAFNEERTAIVPIEGVSVKETVGQVIDLPSLVDMYILHEIVCNPDVGWSSFYFSLDMGPEGNRLLTFEAPWDFDSAFGIRSGYESAVGLYAAYAGNPWLALFAEQPWFTGMVRERWEDIRASGIPERALQLAETLTVTYRTYFERNYERWPSRIEEGNHELIEELNCCRSQREAADYLCRWLSARFAWLDAQWQ